MRLAYKCINDTQWTIHPDARDAYLFSTKLEFQLSKHWGDALELPLLAPPWAIYDDTQRCYLVFSNWKHLLPDYRGKRREHQILVWPDHPDSISLHAWRYTASLFDCSVHRKTQLYQLAHFIDVVPTDIFGALRNAAKGSRSLETLTRLYSEGTTSKKVRSPARTAVAKYLKDKLAVHHEE
ncbi:hypothetical protein [Pseudoalteromonas ruthenica]|uniref:hypothetical protein n=1 Tax=Pseudoalteromonas ruthenica TaxID=151081 RepID=UPI00241BEABE|nr:hypothetical protein [Pseudoalteromonas ruthenica]|tara:strand:+ start:17734 stop:18276 length:543 start_codon:yes stop_codon:yes gene_type:complete